MKKVWVFVLVAIIGVIIDLLLFTGLNWSDDPGYVYDAYRVLNGNFFLGAYLPGLRLMMIYSTALFFFLFGVSQFSAVLFPFLSYLGLVLLCYLFSKYIINDLRVGLLAAIFITVIPIVIAYSTWPMPDIPSAFFTGLSIFLFLYPHRKRVHLFFSGFFTGLAYLLRVSGLIPFLFFIPYIIYECIQKKKVNYHYVFLFLGIGSILLLEGLWYYSNTEDFLLRYHVVSNFYTKDRPGINSALDYYPYVMFNLDYFGKFRWDNLYLVPFGIFFYFIFLSFFYIAIYRKKIMYNIALWFLIFFSYLEFGSMSFFEYIPIHKLDRHLTVILLPGMLMLAYFLLDILNNKKPKGMLLRKVSVYFVIGFLLVTSLFYANNYHLYLYTSTYDVRKSYEFLKTTDKYIYTDIGTLLHLRFYFGFQNNERIKNLAFASKDDIKDSFVVLYGNRGVFEKTLGGNNLKSWVFDEQKNWVLVKKIQGPKIDIWKYYDALIYYVPKDEHFYKKMQDYINL